MDATSKTPRFKVFPYPPARHKKARPYWTQLSYLSYWLQNLEFLKRDKQEFAKILTYISIYLIFTFFYSSGLIPRTFFINQKI